MFDDAVELASDLAASGVDLAFGVTGSGASLAFIRRLEDGGARYFATSHEAAAAIMAGAASADTDRTAVSVSIRGPGFGNMVPGILFNRFEGNPAVSVSEAIAPEVPWSRRHKRIDQPSLGLPITKAFAALPVSADLARRLIGFAGREVRGPVHIDLCANGGLELPALDEPELGDALPAEAEATLRQAARPVLVVGSLALRRSWGARLADLSIPVLTTAAAKGALDEGTPFSAGVITGAGVGVAPECRILPDADLVVGLGLRTREMLDVGPGHASWLVADEASAAESTGFERQVVGGLSEAGAHALLDRLEGKAWGEALVRETRTAVREALLSAAFNPSHVFDVLNELPLPHGLVLDTGAFCTLGEHLWRSGPGRPFRGSSIARWMGASIPQAIGYAIRSPQRAVICVMGDGGAAMYAPEIRLAVAERLPICFILLTDGHYGSVIAAADPARISTRAVTVAGPSWWRAVEAMGCEASPASSAAELEAELAAWSASGPKMVEIAFDPETYRSVAPMIRR